MEVRADEDGSGGAIIKYYYLGALSALRPLSWKERRRLHEDTKTAIVEGKKGGRRRQPRKYRLSTKDHDISARRRQREEEEEEREGLRRYNGKYFALLLLFPPLKPVAAADVIVLVLLEIPTVYTVERKG